MRDPSCKAHALSYKAALFKQANIMDDDVLAAMARWPNVPAVCGWLSLDQRGRWRLHPLGDAAAGGPGEPITNTRILAFMDRNYTHDDSGRWFFQNGPQRVFVRLDAAPYVLRVASETSDLVTHTGIKVNEISAWYADEHGRFYAATEHGAGMVEDRDLASVLDAMTLANGSMLLEALPSWLQDGAQAVSADVLEIAYAAYPTAQLKQIHHKNIEQMLGFIANPVNSQTA